MSKISWPLLVEKKPPLEIISTFSKGITLTPTHSSSLWVKVANCLAEGSSLKSLWLDGCQKLFLLRNVSDLYIYISPTDIAGLWKASPYRFWFILIIGLLTTAGGKETSLTDNFNFLIGIILTLPHSSGLWVKVANCLAEGSSLKSLWLDGFEKLFVLRNVTDIYIYTHHRWHYVMNTHTYTHVVKAVHSSLKICG